jgi:NTE family protein
VFLQTSPDWITPDHAPPRTLFRTDHIGPHHALASAAIPMLFPPVRIEDELYLDGGLRQNTPIAPALRLGASHVFAIGGSREIKGINTYEGARRRVVGAPGAAFLLGKVLNAFLLDHIDTDIELLTRLNKVLEDGTEAYGEAFLASLNEAGKKRGAPAYRHVDCMTVRPSEDIGRLAGEFVRKGRYRGDPLVAKHLITLLDMGAGDEADLASYLLFDGRFCRQLIEMGRADAHARRDALLAFFGDRSEDGGGEEGEASGTWDRASVGIPVGD